MGAISVGEAIKIPCQVKPGPFSEEKFVSFDTFDGIVSGFVDEGDIEQRGSQSFISGVVKEIAGDRIVVVVRGSFFQTNGIATVSRSTAFAA